MVKRRKLPKRKCSKCSKKNKIIGSKQTEDQAPKAQKTDQIHDQKHDKE
ncbi:hypothetical protein [Pontibacillus chungwhensis]|nr:hypothetical protein [Pontibacillus chungwhensis]